MADKGERFVGAIEMLEDVAEVMSAKMELSGDGWRFVEDDLGASSVSCSRRSSAWLD